MNLSNDFTKSRILDFYFNGVFTVIRYDYPHHDIEPSVWWYYMIELSFYWSLSISQFTDVRRKDFVEMFIHHITTIALLSFSWTCNLTRCQRSIKFSNGFTYSFPYFHLLMARVWLMLDVAGAGHWFSWRTTVATSAWSWPRCCTTPGSTPPATPPSASSSACGPPPDSGSFQHGYSTGYNNLCLPRVRVSQFQVEIVRLCLNAHL